MPLRLSLGLGDGRFYKYAAPTAFWFAASTFEEDLKIMQATYVAVKKIHFDGAQFHTDSAAESLQ